MTYVLVDTPLFSTVQWLYLSVVIGETKVNLVTKKESRIKQGIVNIVPVQLADELSLECDLFVSTWGLSEANKKTVDLVMRRNWFGASHFLVAFQKGESKFPVADRVRKEMEQKGVAFERVEFPMGSKYAFK